VSQVVNQSFHTVRNGLKAIGVTVVRLDNAADSIEVPYMLASSGCVFQLRRPGQSDKLISVSQDDINTVSLDSGAAGDEVLIVTLHNDPILEKR
jgi:hypothetical protein